MIQIVELVGTARFEALDKFQKNVHALDYNTESAEKLRNSCPLNGICHLESYNLVALKNVKPTTYIF